LKSKGDEPGLEAGIPVESVEKARRASLKAGARNTDPVRLDATATSGNGGLLGNVLTTLQNTLGTQPAKLALLSSKVSAILAKVMGILNASNLTLPASAISSLPPALQTLAQPNLIPHAAVASATIFDLVGGSLPVGMDVLGLGTTSTRVDLKLSAVPGDGQILGNLLYNLANLTNPVV